jgi:hypothetical protein
MTQPSRAERARRTVDAVLRAPGRGVGWLTDPVWPERVGAAIGLALLVGALYSGSQGGPVLAAIYCGLLVAPTIRRRLTGRIRDRRAAREIKGDDA